MTPARTWSKEDVSVSADSSVVSVFLTSYPSAERGSDIFLDRRILSIKSGMDNNDFRKCIHSPERKGLSKKSIFECHP